MDPFIPGYASKGEILSRLTPEQMQQLMQLGALDDEGGDLKDQIAQAQALQAGTAGHHVSPLGAAFGGLADTMRAFHGAQQEKGLRARQKDLAQQKTDLRSIYAKALMGDQASAPDIGPAGGLQEAQMMGPGAPQPQGPVMGTTPYGAGPYGYTPGGGGY